MLTEDDTVIVPVPMFLMRKVAPVVKLVAKVIVKVPLQRIVPSVNAGW